MSIIKYPIDLHSKTYHKVCPPKFSMVDLDNGETRGKDMNTLNALMLLSCVLCWYGIYQQLRKG